MNSEDIKLVHQVRRALDQQLDTLPASTLDRLAAARAQAMARKKPHAAMLAQAAPAQALGAKLGSVLAGMGGGRWAIAAPLLALVLGFGALFQYQQQRHISHLADIDAAVLTDELPLNAYLDPGFSAYLESKQQQ